MDRDDDDGVGFVAESHYLKSPTVAEQQAMALLQIPKREGREGSISSNVSDMDVPIYSSENLTTSPRRPVHSVSPGNVATSIEKNTAWINPGDVTSTCSPQTNPTAQFQRSHWFPPLCKLSRLPSHLINPPLIN
ncbi:hypothetical protein Zmor_013031 [Zophobas morio]|uniref:Uncharacterized protein n=1 Tax=Zophobas morio TaxID=2755281 RepID=A0AA38MEX7_9CUCU|nr:hypothetical protein Zmor_013031 [Zophobas morio]